MPMMSPMKLNTSARKAAAAAYSRIPEPDAATGGLGMVLGLPALIVAVFTLSALGVI